MKKYRFGFSLKGLICFMLVMAPNIIWMIVPPANDILAGNNSAYPLFDIVLNVSQWLMVALLIIFINKEGSNKKRTRKLLGAAAFCLAGYYILWVCYFAGVVNPWSLVGMAVLPSIYFIFVVSWLRNYIAIIPTVIFGITHIVITCLNYL